MNESQNNRNDYYQSSLLNFDPNSYVSSLLNKNSQSQNLFPDLS